MDRSGTIAQRVRKNLRTLRNDFCTDRYGRFFGRAGSDIEADRSHDPFYSFRTYSFGSQPFHSSTVGRTRAHRSDVANIGVEGGNEHGDIELVIMGQHADSVERTQSIRNLSEIAVRPIHDYLVGFGEPGFGGENGPRIAHGDVISKNLGNTHESRSEVDRPKDQHAAGRGKHLNEHLDVTSAHLSPEAIVAGPTVTDVKGCSQISNDNRVEFGLPHRPVGLTIMANCQFGPEGREVCAGIFRAENLDDGGVRHRYIAAKAVSNEGKGALH